MKECNQCGRCCLKYGGSGFGQASDKDIIVWELEKPEVMSYVDSVFDDIWISPVTGEEMDRCPWLRKYPKRESYYCRINEVRPTVCRNYPVHIEQMRNDKCEMLEVSDLIKTDNELMIELNKLRRTKNET